MMFSFAPKLSETQSQSLFRLQAMLDDHEMHIKMQSNNENKGLVIAFDLNMLILLLFS